MSAGFPSSWNRPDRPAIRFAPDPAPQGGRETPTLGAGREPALGENLSSKTP